MYMQRDFLEFYLHRDISGKLAFKGDLPLAFINTCRSEDGRRGVFAPVILDNNSFLDAIDISRYIYSDGFWMEGDDGSGTGRFRPGLKKALTLGQACNTSELFPIFSGATYIDSVGYFVDGGYHENSGLKTTMEVYKLLVDALDSDRLRENKDYFISVIYLKNGQYLKKYYPQKIGHENAGLQPFLVLAQVPFGGNASFFEEEARKQYGRRFIRFQLHYDCTRHELVDDDPPIPEDIQREMSNDITDNKADTSLNFPLARWLSNYINKYIVTRSKSEFLANDSMQVIIRAINGANPNPKLASNTGPVSTTGHN
jgi:hypothetical protein